MIAIQISGSELWPRKVELTCTHLKNNYLATMSILHIKTKLVAINVVAKI